MKRKQTNHAAQMRAEYDLDYSKAVRGKYFKRLQAEGSNVVVLDRDVAKEFPTDRAVNSALRRLIRERKRATRPARARRERRSA